MVVVAEHLRGCVIVCLAAGGAEVRHKVRAGEEGERGMYVHVANTAVRVMRTQVHRGAVQCGRMEGVFMHVQLSSLHVLGLQVKVVSCVSGCMHARDVLFGKVQVKATM
jgi:hypothetical protein